VSNLSDQVNFLPYQQVRLVRLSERQTDASQTPATAFQPAFQQLPDTPVTPLPTTSSLAPMDCLARDASRRPIREPAPSNRQIWTLDDASLGYQPVYWPNIKPGYGPAGQPNKNLVPFDPTQGYWSRLDTFYIVFDRFGGLRRFPDTPILAGVYTTHYWCRDMNQPYPQSDTTQPPIFPLVDHPDRSARGVLVYDRNQFQELPNADPDRRAFLEKARPIYVTRSLGELAEGRQ